MRTAHDHARPKPTEATLQEPARESAYPYRAPGAGTPPRPKTLHRLDIALERLLNTSSRRNS